ncbi:MAG: nitroreductase family deazaflavin-dependent oxidoreductase [bacterium]
MTSARTAPKDGFLVKLVTNHVSTWLIRTICSPLDPLVMRATNGRFSTMGPTGQSMITLTMTGRRSGKPRSIQLTSIEHLGDRLVVASAMGSERHPAWRYNLEANADVEVQAVGERYRARAEMLSDDEKGAIWDEFREQVPMIRVYERRTDRNIRVFRIRRAETD